MSYCRFSSDNYSSDIYCYEAEGGGFVIHIAGNRVVGDVPKIDWGVKEPDILHKQYRAQMDYLATALHYDIDLPHAGESFYCGTAGECANQLVYLRDLGYNVPQRAIESLKEEENDA